MASALTRTSPNASAVSGRSIPGVSLAGSYRTGRAYTPPADPRPFRPGPAQPGRNNPGSNEPKPAAATSPFLAFDGAFFGGGEDRPDTRAAAGKTVTPGETPTLPTAQQEPGLPAAPAGKTPFLGVQTGAVLEPDGTRGGRGLRDAYSAEGFRTGSMFRDATVGKIPAVGLVQPGRTLKERLVSAAQLVTPGVAIAGSMYGMANTGWGVKAGESKLKDLWGGRYDYLSNQFTELGREKFKDLYPEETKALAEAEKVAKDASLAGAAKSSLASAYDQARGFASAVVGRGMELLGLTDTHYSFDRPAGVGGVTSPGPQSGPAPGMPGSATPDPSGLGPSASVGGAAGGWGGSNWGGGTGGNSSRDGGGNAGSSGGGNASGPGGGNSASGGGATGNAGSGRGNAGGDRGDDTN